VVHVDPAVPRIVDLERVPDPFGLYAPQIDACAVGERVQIAIDHKILEYAPHAGFGIALPLGSISKSVDPPRVVNVGVGHAGRYQDRL
jgi:hypothetical protein